MNARRSELGDEAVRRNPRLKVLFTMGYARNAIIDQGRLDPGLEIVFKPYTYSELASKLRRVSDGKRRWDHQEAVRLQYCIEPAFERKRL